MSKADNDALIAGALALATKSAVPYSQCASFMPSLLAHLQMNEMLLYLQVETTLCVQYAAKWSTGSGQFII